MYENIFTAPKRPPRFATVCFVVAQGCNQGCTFIFGEIYTPVCKFFFLVWPNMRLQLGRPRRIRSSQFEANAAFMQIHWVRQQLRASGDKAFLISEIKAARQADEGDFRHLDEIHSAFSPSYRGRHLPGREAAWKSRNQVKQLVADFPGVDCDSKYCCSAPSQLAPHPSIASSQTDFSPPGPDSSCKFLQQAEQWKGNY